MNLLSGLPGGEVADILPLLFGFRSKWFAENQLGVEAVMRFNLVDRILDVEPGRRIRTAKNLTLAEEYLADHFPTFPVMPGVLMLQTLIEAGAWLLRITDDFQHSVIVLREARNVKYGNFMEPGKSLVVTAELSERCEGSSDVTFKGKGEVAGNSTVSARFTLTRYNLRDRNPALESVDKRIVEHLRGLYVVLSGGLQPRIGEPGALATGGPG
jgi:3-hydroxyacyl-[acyl-carrier-protein] dehydratase